MIVTREWLSEFLDLSAISSDEICKTLNNIGLEVDSFQKLRVPAGVVVGKVLECKKHPDANKLNICQVDIDDSTKQIVCGAKNVAKDQMVAVATVGTDLGDGFVIKEAKLRGVDSHGMICGSNEIGLPKLNDGIWVLDKSLGELRVGKALSEISVINDDIIDIELTANRGDCLSIYGVARDLSSALNIELKQRSYDVDLVEDLDISLECDDEISLAYTKIEQDMDKSALIEFRLGIVGLYSDINSINLLRYVSHSTGVLLRAYKDSCKDIRVDKVDGLYQVACNKKVISTVGVNQVEDTKVGSNDRSFLVEASYVDPNFISKAVMGKKIEKDELFYNSSRGSESDLDFAFEYLGSLLLKDRLSIVKNNQKPKYSHSIDITFSKIDTFIGEKIDRDRVVSILQKLRFDLDVDSDKITLNIPTFRHDIINEQDVIEEIVRIVSIDNITSKPLYFSEKNRINSAYIELKKQNYFRNRAAGAGFYEAIHYFFDSKQDQIKYQQTLLKDSLDVTNPITSDLNTLRTSLLLHLIRSASSNLKNGKSSVSFFEIGKVVDENRNEIKKIAFLMSGTQVASISDDSKSKGVDFLTFASKVMGVIGEFKVDKKSDGTNLLNPYEMAEISIDDKIVGVMARVHIDVERDYDLDATYVCEIDFDALKYEKILAKPYSKFPALSRDLSLLVPKNLSFSDLRELLESSNIDKLVNFYPIDLYSSDELGEFNSITVRFILQSVQKTMEEEEITAVMQHIMKLLKDKFSLELR